MKAHTAEVEELRKSILISGRMGYEYGMHYALTSDEKYSREAFRFLITNSYHIVEAQ